MSSSGVCAVPQLRKCQCFGCVVCSCINVEPCKPSRILTGSCNCNGIQQLAEMRFKWQKNAPNMPPLNRKCKRPPVECTTTAGLGLCSPGSLEVQITLSCATYNMEPPHPPFYRSSLQAVSNAKSVHIFFSVPLVSINPLLRFQSSS